MPTFWRSLLGSGLLLAALLCGAAPVGVFAHHPEHLRVSELAVLDTAEGAFLQMRVDVARGGGPLRLRSVVVDGEGAALEHLGAEGYQPVEGVVLGEGVRRFGAGTPFRVRLHDGVLTGKGYGDSLGLTALFEPGYLISQEISVSALPLDWLVAGVAALALLALWLLLRRRAAGNKPGAIGAKGKQTPA